MQNFQNAYIKAAAPNAASKVTKNGFASFLQNLNSEVWKKDVEKITYIDSECPEVGPDSTPVLWAKIQAEKNKSGLNWDTFANWKPMGLQIEFRQRRHGFIA